MGTSENAGSPSPLFRGALPSDGLRLGRSGRSSQDGANQLGRRSGRGGARPRFVRLASTWRRGPDGLAAAAGKRELATLETLSWRPGLLGLCSSDFRREQKAVEVAPVDEKERLLVGTHSKTGHLPGTLKSRGINIVRTGDQPVL